MLIIGLTGGIGCGKSTVSKLFQDLGTPVIDADIIAHQIVEPGQPALQELRNTFGSSIFNTDGKLNRAELRLRVFSDPAKKQQLEAILHPRVYAEIDRAIQQLNHPYCIVCIPLLLETHMESKVDRILVIDCPVETQIERVQKRDGMSSEMIHRILANQVSRATRLARADDIIENTKSAEQLADQVKKFHNLYQKGL